MTSADELRLACAFAAAFIAGGINSVAGGGTMVSFPALVGLGLPAIIANATNTVGIWPGSVGSVWGFRRELKRVQRRMWWLLVPAMGGGLIGALLLRGTPSGVFDWLVPWLVIFATALFAMQAPVRRRLERMAAASTEGSNRSGSWLIGALCVQFLVGIYGGYFGAGISIMMLAVLGIMGMTDILEMNAMTSVLSGGVNGVAGILFAVTGLVSWPYIGAMAAGSIIGGYSAAGVARRIKKTTIRRFIILVGVTIAATMFWRVLSRP